MANLDDLFNNPESANWFRNQGKGTSLVPKGTAIVPRGAAVTNPLMLLWGATVPSIYSGIKDEYKYNKSLKDYQNVAFKNYLNNLGYEPSMAEKIKELQREQGDFNKLYYKNNPMAGTLAQKIMRNTAAKGGKAKTPVIDTTPVIGGSDDLNLKQIPPLTPAEQDAIGTADDLIRIQNIPQGNIPQVNTQRVIPTELNGGITPIQTNGTIPNQVAGQPTGGASQLQLSDIIELARKTQEQKNTANNDYINLLQDIIKNQEANSRRSFYRDLGLAGLSGLTKNPAYTKLIGQYTQDRQAANRLALQQQLAQAQQGQVFDPTTIIGNAALMDRLGLPIEAALANKNAMSMYGNVYGTMTASQDRAAQRVANELIAKMREQQFYDKLAQDQYQFDNPHYNDLASQAQMAATIMNNAQFNPQLRQMLTPEFINYAMGLTGFTQPTGVTQQQQQQPVIPRPQRKTVYGGR